jgi:hypothetical protein
VEVKCLFSTAPKAKKRRRKEVNGVIGHWTRRGLGTTGASGQWQQLCVSQGTRVCNRRVWSLAEPERPVTHLENSASLRANRTRWHIQSRATGHVRSTKLLSGTSLDSDRTLALSRSIVAWSASDHTLPEIITFHDRWKSNERYSKRDTWRASVKSQWCDQTLAAFGRLDQRVRSERVERHLEPNGSFFEGWI